MGQGFLAQLDVHFNDQGCFIVQPNISGKPGGLYLLTHFFRHIQG